MDLIPSRGFKYHLEVDDSQMYISVQMYVHLHSNSILTYLSAHSSSDSGVQISISNSICLKRSSNSCSQTHFTYSLSQFIATPSFLLFCSKALEFILTLSLSQTSYPIYQKTLSAFTIYQKPDHFSQHLLLTLTAQATIMFLRLLQ